MIRTIQLFSTDMQRKIITIGTGSGFAMPDRGGPACLVQIDKKYFLLDCGEGTAGWLNKLGVTDSVSSLFISHLHPDHISGLFVLIQNMKLLKRTKVFDVYLPEEGIKPLLHFLPALYVGSDNLPFELNFIPIHVSDIYKSQSLILRAWKSDHFKNDSKENKVERPAFGFTIDTVSKERLIYTGDINSTDCFEKELSSETVLICEAMHIDIDHIIKIAIEKNLSKVIFTHTDPFEIDYILNKCSMINNIILAHDGQEFIW